MKGTILEAIQEAMRLHEHAFIRGCGRETMADWVRKTPSGNNDWKIVTAGNVRRSLMKLVENGDLMKVQNKIGYSTFIKPPLE